MILRTRNPLIMANSRLMTLLLSFFYLLVYIKLESDTKNCNPKDPKCVPKLSKDEALCRYGQAGIEKKEACKRVKAVGGNILPAAKEGRSLGGAYAI